MRRFVAGLTILVFMTLAGEVAAQSNGTADPVGLISSAVIQPFWSVGPDFTLIELTSPVFFNTDRLHAIFFNSDCNRLISLPIELTINGIALIDTEILGVPSVNGLMVLARSGDGVTLIPIPQFPFAAPDFLFAGPLHSRGHWVSFLADHINEVDPIAVSSPETLITSAATLNQQTYSPLRTAATWTNLPQIGSVSTVIILICPGDVISTIPASAGFPPAPPIASSVRGVIYNNEVPVIDFTLNCDCLTPVLLTSPGFAGTYLGIPNAAADSDFPVWYTEISGGTAAFTGYKLQTTDVGGTSFSRLFNASTGALQGDVPDGIPPVLGGR